jgi:hypothetical protein
MKKIIFGTLMLISLSACTDPNQKALKEALDKANITISKQDSALAVNSYRCNYFIDDAHDTIYEKIVGRDTIELSNQIYRSSETALSNDLNRLHMCIGRAPLVRTYYKHITQYQADSIIAYYLKTYSKEMAKREKVVMSYYKRIEKFTLGIDGHTMNASTTAEFIKNDTLYRYIGTRVPLPNQDTYATFTFLRKDYSNLYNVKKID